MFTTGFSMDAASQAEKPEGETVQWMRELAKQKNAAVCGSLIIEDDGAYYNRLFWVEPSGKLSSYNKRHLFQYAGEGDHYTAGTERIVVEYLGWRICPLICYDLRFPVWSRNRGDYDLLIYVANWPNKRRKHWNALLAARAIENQSYTVGVNVFGVDGNGHEYDGDSAIIGFDGQRLEHLNGQAGILSATIDKESQDRYRQKLPFLKDGDQFKIAP